MFSKQKVLLLCSMMIPLILLIASCAPVQVQQQPVQQQVEVTVPPSAPEVAAEPVEIQFWVSATPEMQEVLEGQLEKFAEIEPDIQVVFQVLPFTDFYTALLAAIAAGEQPDVVMLSYNQVSLLQSQGSLEPLDSLASQIDLGDFLIDAVNSSRFNDTLYSLPWQRSACLPHYQYLALTSESQNPEAAFRLMDFLAQPEQQKQNFDLLQVFPIRQSLYLDLEIDCPTIEAIRLTTDEVSQTVDLVNNNLAPTVGLELNAFEASAVFENEIHQGTGAPIVGVISSETFLESLNSENGAIIGALLIENAPEYEPDAYVVKCFTEEVRNEAGFEVPCVLVKPNGDQVEIDPQFFLGTEETQGPVGQSAVVIEVGSRRVCFYIDGRRYCFQIG